MAATITMGEALRLYRAGNDAGLGYAPYTDECGEDDSVEAAIEAAIADGWDLIHDRTGDHEVAVLGDADGQIMAIGDACGAWAVIVSEVRS